ncbi:MAG: Gfo/Idh/MocA family oxidoreductase [bacterium]|nr:Gfo/Idh/MocA family oxidoreductase [bacterium]
MKKINVAVIGCGRMGHNDIRTLQQSTYVSRIIGCDADERQALITAEEFGISVTMETEDIWNDSGIDLVYITTPNETHASLAIEALQAGKAVMTEKPAGIDRAQIEALLDTWRKTGGFLQVGLECRNYSRLYCRMKELLEAGEIGKLINVHFTYSMPPFPRDEWKYKASAGNMCMEKLCHYIDLVRWWNGSRVNRFMAVRADNVVPYYEIADNFHVTYGFENGTVSHLYFNMAAAHEGNYDLLDRSVDLIDQDKMGLKHNYVLVGTEGAIESDLFQRELRLFHHAGKQGFKDAERLVLTETWNREDDSAYFHNTHAQNLDIARRVALGEEPAINPEDAAETMRLCLEFEEAAAAGTWNVCYR